jgi:hypothetical protein
MSQIDLEKARQLARQLARRAQAEPAFAERILNDPIATLTDAGLPEDFVEEFLIQTQLSDVQGYHALSCGLTVLI